MATNSITNPLKKLIFSGYCKYIEPIPIKNGKYHNLVPAWIVKNLIDQMGYAMYHRNNIAIELSPLSLVDRKLILGKEHDSLIIELIVETLSQGGTFLDIGANVGYFSLFAAKLPNVRVLAFEPSPREVIKIYRNIYLNKLANIAVFPYGLADKEQIIPLNIAGKWNPSMNSVVNLANHADEQINCYFDSLDSLCSRSILSDVRLCKIDVEGFEVSVLKGMAASMDLMTQATFVVEISPGYLAKAGYKPKDIYDFFASYGYEPKFNFEEVQNFDYNQDNNEVFVKKVN